MTHTAVSRPLAALAALTLSLAARGADAQAPATPSATAAAIAAYQSVADRIIAAATADSAAWQRVATLTDTFGPRLSGSASLEQAIDWVLARMKEDGLRNVRGEPVTVPHWVRGEERATLTAPRQKRLTILGLGGTVATPAGGITAPVLVVSGFDDLTAHAAQARGKIVLFDVPFTTYNETVRFRGAGPSAAARVGAVAMLLRSVASASINSPHTGSLRYDTTTARIPAAAVTVEDAMLMHRMQDRGQTPVVSLSLGGQYLPDAQSRNVIGELVGREQPDEVVVIGGHIDSWDVGQGAMDDAGGVVAAWEALRVLKRLGLTPRRTIRVVGFTNEENGTRGGVAYRDTHKADLERHVFAMESDNGAFRPRGLRWTGSDAGLPVAREIGSLLQRIGADTVVSGEGEADIGPLLAEGVPGFSLDVDASRYFWYHHSDADMMTVLDRGELARCVAVMAVAAYVAADMPEPLPRTAPASTPARR